MHYIIKNQPNSQALIEKPRGIFGIMLGLAAVLGKA